MPMQRVTLTQDVYMNLDSQWQIVLSGTVIDMPASVSLSPSHITVVGPIANNPTVPTSVSNKRTK